MKRILFITHHYLNGYGGGCYASSAFINALTEIADSLTLLYPMKDGTNPRFLNNKKIRAIPVWYRKNKMLKLLDLICGKVHRYQHISNYINNEQFDYVFFDTSVVSFRLIDYFRNKNCKIICIHHNYQYEYFRDNTKGILKPIILFWCKKYEKEAVRKSDINLTLTEEDSKTLSKKYGTSNEVFKNIGVFEFHPYIETNLLKSINIKSPVFIITGSLGDIQTENSLKKWIKLYYPILDECYPNHQLLISGKSPSDALYKICRNHKKITIIPNPTKMEEILIKGDVFICPTELGGGIKLRIMDGLHYGMPVISHTISARGYDFFEKKGYLLRYDNPMNFKRQINKLKEKNIDRQNIIQLYKNQCSLESGIKKLSSLL